MWRGRGWTASVALLVWTRRGPETAARADSAAARPRSGRQRRGHRRGGRRRAARGGHSGRRAPGARDGAAASTAQGRSSRALFEVLAEEAVELGKGDRAVEAG